MPKTKASLLVIAATAITVATLFLLPFTPKTAVRTAVVEQGALVAGISSGGGDYIRTRRAAAWLRRHAAQWAEGSDE